MVAQTKLLSAPRWAILLLVGLSGAALGALFLLSIVRALPAAGVDAWDATAQVVVASRIGQETIDLSGNITVERGDPYDDGGVEVVDIEIVALTLTGQSQSGPIEIRESSTLVSTGELRSLQAPPVDFPASSFFDAYLEVSIPGSPAPVVVVHNEDPLRVTANAPLADWPPPAGAIYEGTPDAPPDTHCSPPSGPGGLPLLPSLPAQICILSVDITVGDAKTPVPTPTITPTATVTHTRTPLSPTDTVTPGGVTSTPTPTFTPITPTATPSAPTSTPIPSAGNDNFGDAMTVATLPFSAAGSNEGTTTEPGEPLNPNIGGNDCILVTPSAKGSTVWFKFTAPESQTIVADTIGSLLDTVLAAYTGPSVDALTPLVCNDDAGGGLGLRSRITFAVVAGQTYYLQLGGYGSSTGAFTINIGPLGFSTPTPTITPGGGPVGDADCNGIVNSLDAALMLQADAALIDDVPCPASADANLDGLMNAVDAFLVLQLEAGLLTSLPP